jgi:hypothetical protein
LFFPSDVKSDFSMHPNSPTDALLTLLNRAYEPIVAIEQAMSIVVSDSDFRPRIEHFHDAVRAFASGAPLHLAGTRLSIEKLAMDAQRLKAIQEAPLHPSVTKRGTSASQALVPTGPTGGMHPSQARSELTTHYKTYGVLFVALLADAADKNFQARQESLNGQVEEIGVLEQEVKSQPAAVVDLNNLIAAHVWDPDLKHFLQARMTKQNVARKAGVNKKEALTFLKAAGKAIDASILAIDAAHMAFGSVQLVFYEQSKDVVKNMAMQGLNVAGKFLQEALGAAMGRGGRGR